MSNYHFETCRHLKTESIGGEKFCIDCGLVLDDDREYVSSVSRLNDTMGRSKTSRREVKRAKPVVNTVRRQINEFQGTYLASDISEEVYGNIHKHLLDSGDEIEKCDVRLAMKTLGYQRYYNATHHIFHAITRTPNNDISEHAVRLEKDIKRVHDACKGVRRPNTQQLMYLILNSYYEDYEDHDEFDMNEFMIPKSEIKREYEVHKLLVRVLGW